MQRLANDAGYAPASSTMERLCHFRHLSRQRRSYVANHSLRRGGYGGGIDSRGPLTITGSTISGNSTHGSQATGRRVHRRLRRRHLSPPASTLTITNSTSRGIRRPSRARHLRRRLDAYHPELDHLGEFRPTASGGGITNSPIRHPQDCSDHATRGAHLHTTKLILANTIVAGNYRASQQPARTSISGPSPPWA